jgi:hypothetical protein
MVFPRLSASYSRNCGVDRSRRERTAAFFIAFSFLCAPFLCDLHAPFVIVLAIEETRLLLPVESWMQLLKTSFFYKPKKPGFCCLRKAGGVL